jgi:peptidoglycan-associated lipoprotein
MIRTHRLIALTMMAAAMVAACRKKPEAAPVPVSETRPTETCDQRCRDSIADADRRARARADSLRRADSLAALARALEAARNTLTARIYFDYDMSDIRDDARAVLDAKLPLLRANPAMRLRISGHADERGSDDYNIALGQRRAASTRRYLMDNGIDAGRLEIVSYGEAQPAMMGADEGAWRQNRRCEFEIIAGGQNIVVP